MNQSKLKVPSAGKNTQLVLSAGKHATSAKRRKTCNQAKRRKTRNWCQARENMQLVLSAGKHATSAKRRKTRK